MPELWWPEARRRYLDPGPVLSFTGGPPKGLLHTTEGSSIAGAVAAYRANRSWPHITMTFEGGFSAEQHMPIDRAARSLRNRAGGVETNRDHVIQAELVAYAADPRPWHPEFLDGVRRWMRWVEANAGVPRRCGVDFIAYPASYGASRVRLSGPAWDAYSGWLGHMHAPENTHGDPGAIPIAYLLDEEDDMALTDDERVLLEEARQNAIDAKNYGVANQAAIEALARRLDGISTGGVDLDALAARLGDELARRMAG